MDRLDLSRDVRARLSELSRRNGETEDRLLRRLLGLAGKDPGSGSATPINAGSGFEDATYAILFPEGFEISRTYKGRPYAARVVRGRWRAWGAVGGGRGCGAVRRVGGRGGWGRGRGGGWAAGGAGGAVVGRSWGGGGGGL